MFHFHGLLLKLAIALFFVFEHGIEIVHLLLPTSARCQLFVVVVVETEEAGWVLNAGSARDYLVLDLFSETLTMHCDYIVVIMDAEADVVIIL